MTDDDLRPGVLLDVDGTLLDTNYLHVLAWWQALHAAGHDEVTMAQVHRAIGIASEGLLERLLGRVDEAAIEGHSERFAALRDQVTAFPQVPDLLRRLTAAGYAPVLATSGAAEDLEWMRPALGAPEELAGATTSEDVDSSKPAPDLLGRSLELHRLDPERSVVVGDTVWDVESARRAGLPCIGLTCGGISEAELREAGADEVHEDPAALLAAFDTSLLGRRLRGGD